MFTGNINRDNNPKRIIVAPLDWGLGHATRCIPIIHALIKAGAEVILAADGACSTLLKSEFQELEMLHLEGYHIHYASSRFLLKWKLFSQFSKIRKKIKAEHEWMKKTVKEKNIDAVISDNRFGLYYSEIPCIFITHQLQIKTGNAFTEKIAQKINYKYINQFSQCWVADGNEESIAGELSYPEKYPSVPIEYTGILSRMKEIDIEIKYDYTFLISGPEPQRSIFEKKIIKLIGNENKIKIAIVRGLPNENKILRIENADVFNHLPANELNRLMCASRTIICRSGYSTIMDLIAIGKSAILIPTPGQTEQEYLAAYLQQKKMFKSVTQKDLKYIFSEKTFTLYASENNIEGLITNFLKQIPERK